MADDKGLAICEAGRVFHVGDVVRKLRKERGWRIEQLAAKSGMNKLTVSRFENDPSSAKHETFTAIARALEMSEREIYALVPESDQPRQAGRLKQGRHAETHPGDPAFEARVLAELKRKNAEVFAQIAHHASSIIALGAAPEESEDADRGEAGSSKASRSRRR